MRTHHPHIQRTGQRTARRTAQRARYLRSKVPKASEETFVALRVKADAAVSDLAKAAMGKFVQSMACLPALETFFSGQKVDGLGLEQLLWDFCTHDLLIGV